MRYELTDKEWYSTGAMSCSVVGAMMILYKRPPAARFLFCAPAGEA